MAITLESELVKDPSMYVEEAPTSIRRITFSTGGPYQVEDGGEHDSLRAALVEARTEAIVTITAIQDRLQLGGKSTAEEERDYYLGLTDSDVAGLTVEQQLFIDDLITGGKEAADTYMQNAFLESDGTEKSIPKQVEIGVIRWVTFYFTNEYPGVLSIRAGDVQINRSVTLVENMSEVLSLWKPYRLSVGF